MDLQSKGHEQKDHHRATGLIQDDLWLEHLEDETVANFAADLEILLENSQADARTLKSLKRTRDLVKASDDVAMPESGHFYQNLHDKIMAAVDFEASELTAERRERALPQSAKVSATTFSRDRKAKRLAMPTIFGAMGLTMMMAFVSWMSLHQGATNSVGPASGQMVQSEMIGTTGPDERIDRSVAQVTRSYSNEVNGFEPEEDVIADATVTRIRGLSPSQVEELYKTLRQ